MNAVASSLRRPAYAREVIAAINSGEPSNIHLHIGTNAWNRAAMWGAGCRLVAPLDFDCGPNSYDFGFLDGQAVTINAVDADLVLARQVAVAVVEQGARLAVMLHPHLPKNAEFVWGVQE